MRASILLLLFLLAGCTEWHPVALPSPVDTAWSASGKLRLTTVSSREIRGTSILLRGDSLEVRTDSLGAGELVARSAAARIDRHGFSGSKTAAFAGVYLALGVLILLILGDSFEEGSLAY